MRPRCGFIRACLVLPMLGISCSVPTSPPPVDDDVVVYVIERGWHTDIGLPAEEITGPLARLEAPFPGVRFLTFGFGERQFVVDRQTGFGAMLSALLPSRSALLATALRTIPEAAFGADNVVALRIPPAGMARIQAVIWQELDRSSDGEPLLLANGPYPGSVFYAADDTYDGLFTCNTWTAATLRAGGLPIPMLGVLFSGQVMGMARWISAHQAH